MSSCIPWATMSGDEIETVVAVCLCKQFPDAQRIRPSRGDGGIDVRVDNEDGTIDCISNQEIRSKSWIF